MITLHEKIDVNRPVEEAFAYIADFCTTREWDSTAISARKLTTGPVDRGTRFEVICRAPLGKIRLQYVLTRLQPGQLIELHGTSRLFDIDDVICFSETGSGPGTVALPWTSGVGSCLNVTGAAE